MDCAGYLHKLLRQYVRFYTGSPGSSRVVEINPPGEPLFEAEFPTLSLGSVKEDKCQILAEADWILLNGAIHYERDLLWLFQSIRRHLKPEARIIIIYYSALWKPLVTLACAAGLRRKTPEQNWISPEDVDGFLRLTEFEPVVRHRKVLLPLPVPPLSFLCNRVLAPIPGFSAFSMVNLEIARPIGFPTERPSSVSVVVPLRNESGNIAELFKRIPEISAKDELIFVEGHSTDDTWEVLQREVAAYKGHWKTLAVQQTGKGKGDAVRLGFERASGEILLILDADLTVPPEDLPSFCNAICSGKAEFINGSRLVYAREKRAMRFANLVANKFFAVAFSYVLGQRLKDTLCGTKVLRKEHYELIAANRSQFGDFDPFGDFDLLFGATRLGLKIVEMPIHYRERTYGTTNIQRWRHGVILLRMLLFAASRIKFI